jgi:hypothetical protein
MSLRLGHSKAAQFHVFNLHTLLEHMILLLGMVNNTSLWELRYITGINFVTNSRVQWILSAAHQQIPSYYWSRSFIAVVTIPRHLNLFRTNWIQSTFPIIFLQNNFSYYLNIYAWNPGLVWCMGIQGINIITNSVLNIFCVNKQGSRIAQLV